jgi:UDP-glucose 4-epimerase
VTSVLITGGSGFVGRAITRELLARGIRDIVVFDQQAPPQRGVSFVAGSILDKERLAFAMRGREMVVHLAAALGVEACQRDPETVVRTNLTGTANVLRTARRSGTRKVLFSSSSEVYGDGHGQPVLTETDTPAPKSLYGRTKMVGELAVKTFAHESGIPCTAIRYFNVYGADQRADFVMSTFVDRALVGAPLVVHGDGGQLRTFTHVEDAARGTVDALFDGLDRPGSYDLFNIGSQQTASILELALLVKRVSGSTSPIQRVAYGELARNPAFEIQRRVPNVAKAKDRLGFEAGITLEAGVHKTIAGRGERLAETATAGRVA